MKVVLRKLLLRLIPIAGSSLLAACATPLPSAPLPGADPIALNLGRPEYRIGPNDLLAITVFQVSDLDRQVRVTNSGQITLPLIGAVDVAGTTVPQLELMLAERYGERYLADPQVSVFVEEFASQRITVSGEVNRPGIYTMTASRFTLLQALALAEGFTDFASHKNVFVLRTVDDRRYVARFDVGGIELGEYDDPELSGEDVVIVDSSLGREVWRYLVQAAPFVAVWRIYR